MIAHIIVCGVITILNWKHVLTYLGLCCLLMFSTMDKTSSRQHFEISVLFFSQEIGFDIYCKLSPIA